MNAAGGLTAMATEVAAPASMPGGPGADSPKSSPNTSMLATSKDGLPQFGSTLLASAWSELTAKPVSPARGVAPEIAAPPKAEKKGIETQTVAPASIAPVPVQLMGDPVREDAPPSAEGRRALLDSQGLPGVATQEAALKPQAESPLGGPAVPVSSDRVVAELNRGALASNQLPAPGEFPQLSEPSAQAADSKAEASGSKPAESKLSLAAHERQRAGENNAILLAVSAMSGTISASPVQGYVGYASPQAVTPDHADQGLGIARDGQAPAISNGSSQGAPLPMTATEVSAAPFDPVASFPAAQLLTGKDVETVEPDKSHDSTTKGTIGSTPDSEQIGGENGSTSQRLVVAARRVVPDRSSIDAENVTPRAPVSPTAVGSNSVSNGGAAGLARSTVALPGSGLPGANAQSMATPGPTILQVGGVPHAGSAMRAESMPGSSAERSAGDTTAGELLTHMDGGGTISASGLRLAPHAVEVGIEDPAHGWIEVRAQGVAGQVTASLNADSPDARAALHAQLPGMAQYLAEHDLGVRDLGVSAGVSGGFASPGHSGDASFGGGSGGFGSDAGSSSGSFSGSAGHADPGADSGRGHGPALAQRQAETGSGETQRGGSGPALASGGHLISVRV